MIARAALRCVSVVVIISVLAGCGNDAETPTDSSQPPQTASPASGDDQLSAPGSSVPDQPTADQQVTVQLASWSEVEKMATSHPGKVVVVDLWSTWCPPCVKEFPNLVALHEKYPDQVACISVNLNYTGGPDESPESHQETVLKFLEQQNATFANVICNEADEQVYTKIDLAGVPAIYVYDKQGQLHKRFDNDSAEYGDEGFTYQQHVIPLVEQLMSQ